MEPIYITSNIQRSAKLSEIECQRTSTTKEQLIDLDPWLPLRENTGGCGGGAGLAQGASDIRGAPRFSPWSKSVLL